MTEDFPISQENAVQALALLLEAQNDYRIFANRQLLRQAIDRYVNAKIFSGRSASEWLESVRHLLKRKKPRSQKDAQVAFCEFVERLPYRNSIFQRVTKLSETRTSRKEVIPSGSSIWLVVDDKISILEERDLNPLETVCNMESVSFRACIDCLTMKIKDGIGHSVVSFKCENPVQVVDKIEKLKVEFNKTVNVIQESNDFISSYAMPTKARVNNSDQKWNIASEHSSFGGYSTSRCSNTPSLAEFSDRIYHSIYTNRSHTNSQERSSSKDSPFRLDRRRLLYGKYLVEDSVAVGNDKVFLVKHTHNQSCLVAKFYTCKEMYQNALNNHRNLDSERVCRCLDTKEHDEGLLPCIIMERGLYTLKEKIQKSKNSSDFAKTDLLLEVAKLIDYLHSKSLVYRDLKPSNIVGFDPIITHLKFIDVESIRPVSIVSPAVYTKEYAAPEIMRNKRRHLGMKITFAQDMWSVGAVAFEIFTGERLFPSENKEKYFNELDYRSYVEQRVEEGMGRIKSPLLDFVCNLLSENPASRMTIKQALNHLLFITHQKLCATQKK